MSADVLSLKEIEKRYPDRWVVLDHVRSDPGPVLRGAVWFSNRPTKTRPCGDCWSYRTAFDTPSATSATRPTTFRSPYDLPLSA